MLSGLRLGEALRLSWDSDDAIAVQVGEKFVKLRIYAEAQKSKRDALLPIAPEFAEFLLATPALDRHGLVFGIEGQAPGTPMDIQRASRIVSDIGEQAKIVIDPNDAASESTPRRAIRRWFPGPRRLTTCAGRLGRDGQSASCPLPCSGPCVTPRLRLR